MDMDLKARSLQKLGNEITVITTYSSENDIIGHLPYKIIEEYIPSKRLLTIQKGIFDILKKYENSTDIFHVDGHIYLYGAGLYRLLGGKIPIVAHFNRELMCWPENMSTRIQKAKDKTIIRVKKKIRLIIEKYIGIPIANHIDLLTFANPVIQKTYENFGLKKDNTNFVDGDFIDHEKIRIKNNIIKKSYIERNKITGEQLNIFYTGRMAPGKGFDTLITAFSKIKNKNKYKLILGGDGEERQNLQKMVLNLKIEKYVKFLGWIPIENIYEYFNQADIFVLPKCMRIEFNSITLLEAMNFGLPCIVPQGGALAWSANKGALNYIDEDCNDLAQKIETLGNNPNLRAELSKNCFIRLTDDEMDYKKRAVILNNAIKKLCKN